MKCNPVFICVMEENLLTLILPHGFSAHRYTDEWEKVDYCTGISHTSCDLSKLTDEYSMSYKVRVQLVVGKNASAWIGTRFQPNQSRCSEKSAPKTLKLWLAVLLLFIYFYPSFILQANCGPQSLL